MWIKEICAGGAAALLLVGAQAAPANASADEYVAVAASSSSDAWGWGIAATKDQATEFALFHCSKGGATDCNWLARGYRCVALARMANGRVEGGIGKNRAAAEYDALHDLGGGWIVSSPCTSGYDQLPPGTVNFDDHQ